MFRKTDRQESLFGPDAHLSDSSQQRLKQSWAEGFHRRVYPILLAAEDDFADLYCADNGTPNWSVARKLGVLLLQELKGLSDQDALDCLGFDVRWRQVQREHLVGVRGQKPPPCRVRRGTSCDHVPAYRGRAVDDAELELQLEGDSILTPTWVVRRDTPNELDVLSRDPRPPHPPL